MTTEMTAVAPAGNGALPSPHPLDPLGADELRRQADAFIELADLAPVIARDPAARAQSQANRAAREHAAAPAPAEEDARV